MFGNSFIDYCATNYIKLREIMNRIDEDLMIFLDPNARMFLLYYKHLTQNTGKQIELTYFLERGLDFTSICLLTFLISVFEGNRTISLSKDLKSVVYFGIVSR